MSYVKQNFKNGEILMAEQLNYMEAAIAATVEKLENTSEGNNYEIGVGLKVTDNTLSVDAAQDFDGDNTRPIEAAFVQAQIGNIETLLQTI